MSNAATQQKGGQWMNEAGDGSIGLSVNKDSNITHFAYRGHALCSRRMLLNSDDKLWQGGVEQINCRRCQQLMRALVSRKKDAAIRALATINANRRDETRLHYHHRQLLRVLEESE
jgi:hypothetical protein